MKIFGAFLIFCISLISGQPIDDYRIIYPDYEKIDEIVGRFGDLKADPKSLLDDPNLLRSGKITEDFLIDKDADTKLENGNYYQGDIILQEDQIEMINRIKIDDGTDVDDDTFGTRTGLIWAAYRWPKDSKGSVVVPYVIDNNHFGE
jgi:hypothetical protein